MHRSSDFEIRLLRSPHLASLLGWKARKEMYVQVLDRYIEGIIQEKEQDGQMTKVGQSHVENQLATPWIGI